MVLRRSLISIVAAASLAGPAWAESPPSTKLSVADYDRAARFLEANSHNWVLNGDITPHWLPGGDRFWYRRQTAPGKAEFVLVDAAAGGNRRPAFDHSGVAKALSGALGRTIELAALPFEVFRYRQGGTIEAMIDGSLWTCGGRPARCTRSELPNPVGGGIVSPDGKWRAFVKDHNIWIRPVDGGEAIALTTDGTADLGWGTVPASTRYMATQSIAGADFYPPAILWSPDSSRILTAKIADRSGREIGLMQSVLPGGEIGPRLYSWHLARPGDPDIPTTEPWIFDIRTRKAVKAAIPPIPFGQVSPIESGEAWWSKDGTSISILARSRYLKTMTLYSIDPLSGGSRELISETAKTFIEPASFGRRPMMATLENGDILWFSERDGQGRLYLFDSDGKLKRVIGKGPGQISSIVRLDEKSKLVFVRANGREGEDNPYLSSLYRANLETGEMVRVTPERAEHDAGLIDGSAWPAPAHPIVAPQSTNSVSPSGKFFVDTYSTVDAPPVTVLRHADGRLVSVLERADVSRLQAAGFRPPEPFTSVSADGKTPLYGVMLRPSNFDPSKKYPVVDSIYPGPQLRRTPNSFLPAVFDRQGFSQALAELGFIVILVDGRGTPGRSKAFLDQSYGDLSLELALQDHVATINQLAGQYPWMDLERVGIYGISAGGYAAARAILKFPDIFKVGVAHAGNHDQRGIFRSWAEGFIGPDDGRNYAAAANPGIARNLKGKLLLMHGDMDPNVSSALTLQLVDALIKSNKDFDMKIIPNLTHAWGDYATRTTWDYMVRNLMGAEPPSEYNLSQAGRAQSSK
jgi:dipeptidyl aminopeptidase/acylaminoacyl peptidase